MDKDRVRGARVWHGQWLDGGTYEVEQVGRQGWNGRLLLRFFCVAPPQGEPAQWVLSCARACVRRSVVSGLRHA